MKNFRIPLLIGLTLIITFMTFLPCLQNDFVNWDDDAYITEITTLDHLSLKNIKISLLPFMPAFISQSIDCLTYANILSLKLILSYII
jgi:hypothetical protein